jgi:sugar O-acyltransferase (sialic acid O-acetyltransferase NeuD family)
VAWLLKALALHSSFDPVCFVEDGATGERRVLGLTTLSLEEFTRSYADASVTVAVGSPALRRSLAAKCEAAGLGFATLISRNVEMSKWVSLGAGVTLCPGCILTVDVVLERHVQLNKDCTIGHDVRIGEFSTLSPGVHVSGNVRIGREVFIGAGATIANDIGERPLVINDFTVIAAGACVTADTEESGLYAGVPAILKKRYDSLPA